MRFGPAPVADAEGAILAHSLRVGKLSLRKGRILSADDLRALGAAGVVEIVVARLEPGDVGEDAAATRIARAAAGASLTASAAFTGRVNLFASEHGLAVVDTGRVDRLNLIDEAVTIATLPAYGPVEPKQMVATVKIIPFAVPGAVVEACEAVATASGPLVRVAAFRPLRVGLVQTRLPGTKETVLDKTVEVTRERLSALGSTLIGELRCGHEDAAVAAAVAEMRGRGADLLLIAGASAITDRRDVLPAGVVQAGGVIEHFGMPVDPGNLLLLAHVGGVPVLGLPGCARSPKLNGFDWVLQRIAADLPVVGREIMLMGAGGLLMEIPSRPLPRALASPVAAATDAPRAPRVAAIVLAAGQSRRMGKANKLLALVDGKPMVAHAVDAALRSQAEPVIVVTGHEAPAVREALGDRKVTVVHNQAYAEGLSTSLREGLAAVGPSADAALVCLGDMPRVAPAVLDRLIAAYNPAEGRLICVPILGKRRGNPVLWDRRFFAEMRRLSGDTGARALIGAHAAEVCEVAVEDLGVVTDIDTPQALKDLQSVRPTAA